MKEKIFEKLLSGRYYLTLVGGLVFSYATYKGILEAQAVSAILTSIFINYFQRQDRVSENGGKP